MQSSVYFLYLILVFLKKTWMTTYFLDFILSIKNFIRGMLDLLPQSPLQAVLLSYISRYVIRNNLSDIFTSRVQYNETHIKFYWCPSKLLLRRKMG